jgi:hypothetical protein
MIGSERLRRAALRASLFALFVGLGMSAHAQKTIEQGGGHEEDVMVDPTLHQFTGVMKSIGKADGKGRILSFRLAPLGPQTRAPAAGEWKGWRLRMLSGARFPEFFEIRDNTPSSATIVAGDRALNGVAANDVFIVESYDRAGHSIFAHKPAPAPGKGG